MLQHVNQDGMPTHNTTTHGSYLCTKLLHHYYNDRSCFILSFCPICAIAVQARYVAEFIVTRNGKLRSIHRNIAAAMCVLKRHVAF